MQQLYATCIFLFSPSSEKLPPLAIDIMKNPFTPRDVIPYAVAFYCEYASKDTEEIHKDLLQTISDLTKYVEVTTGEVMSHLFKAFCNYCILIVYLCTCAFRLIYRWTILVEQFFIYNDSHSHTFHLYYVSYMSITAGADSILWEIM